MAIGSANIDLPQDRRIQFRIGVNLGDVIVEGEDIYGDGVNVAARLERCARDPAASRFHNPCAIKLATALTCFRGPGRAEAEEHREADSRLQCFY